MTPTNKYQNIDTSKFHDGLVAVSIPETRKMILAQDSEAALWGFIDSTGKEIIKPQYRFVSPFFNGVAFAKTIEEDRDDFANYRWIVIDKTGNELAELQILEEGDSYEPLEFQNGYAFNDYGFYTKEGKFVKREDDKPYLIIGDKIIEDEVNVEDEWEESTNTKILIKDFNGNIVNTFSVKNDSISLYVSNVLSEKMINKLSESNTFLANVDGTVALVDASTLKILLKGIELDRNSDEVFDELLLVSDEKDDITTIRIDEANTINGTLYDFKGNKIGHVKDMYGILYNQDRYFTKGNEYYKLVDINGNVLIDEDQKILSVENPLNENSDDNNY